MMGNGFFSVFEYIFLIFIESSGIGRILFCLLVVDVFGENEVYLLVEIVFNWVVDVIVKVDSFEV